MTTKSDRVASKGVKRLESEPYYVCFTNRHGPQIVIIVVVIVIMTNNSNNDSECI